MSRSITFASCTLPVVTPAVCTNPLFASTPTCAFMPEYHWSPFFDDVISGSRLSALFLVEGEAAISVASTIVPPRSISPRAHLLLLVTLAAVVTPASGQQGEHAAAPADVGEQGAASIPDFS